MSERATSVEAGSPLVDSSVVRPDNATEGDLSSPTVNVSDSNGLLATGDKKERSVTEATKDNGETKLHPENEMPAETTTENGTKSGIDTVADEGVATPSSAIKTKSRRKSSGVPEHKGRKLNKKESKAKMSHLHVQPGEHYFIKFKGYPKWPGIIASDDMLPEAILRSRPVTAARPDGTYREDYADGGKNVLDRTFPVMFLDTNEFAWIPNTDFEPLDCNVVGSIPQGKMSKSLFAAYQMAAENHDLDHFKTLLANFEQTRKEAAEAKEANKAKAATKKNKKSKDVVQDEDEDIEMADADEVEKEDKPKSSKKRKAVADDDETSTPKRTDSMKKPKLKLINSAQKTNGAETPKSGKEKKDKAKPKSKKATNGAGTEPVAPKEPELSPEEKRKMKEKEILFLRHKLQKGLLTRDQRPKEEEMKQMSEYITKLEGYSDLEVSIIRVTKINKVLKGILKLDEIPKEAEFKFKERSTELLVKWNKILESDTPAAASAQANGTSKDHTNGEQTKAEEETKTSGLDGKGDATAREVSTVDNDVDMENSDTKKVRKTPQEEEKAVDDKTEAAATEATPVEATA